MDSNSRVAIYARVSTKDQSCEMQLRDLRSYCASRGFTHVREYVDIGESGAKDSRPELNRLMDHARKRQIDAVLVWRFDRFARSTKHLLLALEEFRSKGIQFISYQENMDTDSPLGQALFCIVAAVAQLERDLIRERVSSGIPKCAGRWQVPWQATKDRRFRCHRKDAFRRCQRPSNFARPWSWLWNGADPPRPSLMTRDVLSGNRRSGALLPCCRPTAQNSANE